MKKLCALPILLLLAILPEAPAVAQFVGIPTTIAQLPTCNAGRHGRIWVVRDAVGNDDCSLGGGTDAAICLCSDGNFVAVIAASVPAADSILESMLKAVDAAADEECLTYESTVGDFEWQACGSGTSITLDLGDDGGNDSTALAEIAVVNDNGGAFTEPSADKLSINVAKLRPASWANLPASPHSSDDEFNDGNITGWTIGSGGTTNPATTGTIDYTASLTTPIIDASTIPGWVAFQSDQTASAAGQFYIYKAVTLSTDNTFFSRVSPQARVVSAANEGNVGFSLVNSGDTNELVSIRVQTAGAGWRCESFVQNDGVFTSVSQIANSENQTFFGSVYLVIWKKSNVYHVACAGGDGGVFQYIGAVTKTGVTTFDRIVLYMDTMNETPSFIGAFDFFRMKDSLDYSLLNP